MEMGGFIVTADFITGLSGRGLDKFLTMGKDCYILYCPKITNANIKHFVLFQSDGSTTIKILAGYHQYHATNKAVAKTKEATDEGDVT